MQNQNTTTRRRALQIGSLSAIGAGFMAAVAPTARAAVQAEPAGPLTATISLSASQPDDGSFATWLPEWRAEFLKIRERSTELDRQVRAHPSFASLWKLSNERCDIHGVDYFLTEALRFELLCRHLPGLAPAIRAVWRHIQDDVDNVAISGDLDDVVTCCQDLRFV